MKTLLFSLLAWAVLSLATVQTPLFSFPNDSFESCDSGSFTPLERLSLVSEDRFTTLRHPAYPKYTVRIKKSFLCDETISYTGYIDIEARHIFFYFVESRNNPDKDDVIFWTTGGPGCTSAIGLFMEIGPCRLLDGNGPKFHPESWVSNANILFVDQPIGVGFSYGEYGVTVSDTHEAAKDIAAFVSIFFENFPQFKGRAFHMAGDSYGGRYIPVFASEVYDQNPKLVEKGLSPINLTSIIIGNPYTDFHTMFASYYEYACTSAAVHPILDIQTCLKMKRMLPRCLEWTKQSCIDRFEPADCRLAGSFCDDLGKPVFQSGVNIYDVSRKCEGTIEENLCYDSIIHLSQYLSKEDVRSRFGVDSSVPSNFTKCSKDVSSAFHSRLDGFDLTYHYVAALLERGVKTLVYVGKYDWICNYIGNEAWTLKMEWTGQAEFARQPLREWIVNGKKAGMTRSTGGLTYATVDGAGHLVPLDKPIESLELINRWMSGKVL